MITQELLDYITRHQQAGVREDDIKQQLLNAGWHMADIMEGLNHVKYSPLVSYQRPPATKTTDEPQSNPKLPGVFSLLGQALNIYKRRFWVLLGISAIPLALIFAVGVLAAGGLTMLTVLRLQNGPAVVIAGLLLTVLIFVALIYIGLWSQTAMIYAISGYETPVGFAEAFKRSSHKIASYFVIMFLMGAVAAGGFFLLIIPGIIFSVWYSLSIYVMAEENLTGLSALQKSREYIRGYGWAVFGRMLGFGLLFMLAYFLPILGFNAFFAAAKLSKLAPIISQIFSLIISPLSLIYPYVIYRQIKSKKGSVEIVNKKKTWLAVGAVWGTLAFLLIPVLTITLLALSTARQKARDAKRVADIYLISSGLELYLNDQQTYPENLNQLIPKYLTSVPQAPLPNDGKCRPEENQYHYQLINASDYKLTFCLGQTTRKLESGMHYLGPWGIDMDQKPDSYWQNLKNNILNNNYSTTTKQ